MSKRKIIILILILQFLKFGAFAEEVKKPNVAGAFYSDNPVELFEQIEAFLDNANPPEIKGNIFALISPHAGYGYSGQVAAYGYKLVQNKPYKTVVVIGPSHQYGFSRVSVYPRGKFRTPLGDIEIDAEFAQKLIDKDSDIYFEPKAFAREHSVEVQLPFLQRVLIDFKVVPVVMGDCTLATCKKLADILKEAVGTRQDVLIIASTDMYHGYDFQETEAVDKLTLNYLKNMDAQGLYYGLREGKAQLCGGLGVVSTIMLAKALGHNKLEVLQYTNSAAVTGKKVKGVWTVGYSSCAIDQEKACLPEQAEESNMLNKNQKKRLLEIARNSIETYLKTGKKLEVDEKDPLLKEEMGAFVTLHEKGQLRGCIGHMIGSQPLYLTVRDMAVEAAVGDSRFMPLRLAELKNIEIEISALSPLEKVDSADKIVMGKHGVLVRKGFNSGVYLPQVATETGWSKEEFLSSLCSEKAGLSPDAWKDKSTDIYIFSAEVFSEKEVQSP